MRPFIFEKLIKIHPERSFEIDWFLHNGNSRLKECGLLLKSRNAFRINILERKIDY